MMAVLMTFTVVATIIRCAYSTESLYYTTPGDFSKSDSQGLFGGPFDIWLNGTATNLSYTGINCANLQRAGFYKGINTRSVSYDPMSRKAMVNMQVQSSLHTSAFSTSLCSNQEPQCQGSSVSVIFAQAEPKHSKVTGRLGPFAMWNNSVYFVVNRYENIPGMLIKHSLELRMLDGCEARYPFKRTYPIDIELCSQYLATFAEELGHDLGLGLEDGLSSAPHLYIIQLPNKSLVFLTQVQNQTFDDSFDPEAFSMSLVAVMDGGDPQILHHQDLPVDYAYDRDDISHLGSISYADGTVCWSVWDRILCAKWTGQGPLRDTFVALPQGLVSEEVCNADGHIHDDVDYSSIITGVAIGDAKLNINLVFGCYAGKPHQGGAGLLRINKDGTQRQLFPIIDDAGKIFAGSVFFGCGNNGIWSSSTSSLRESSMSIMVYLTLVTNAMIVNLLFRSI